MKQLYIILILLAAPAHADLMSDVSANIQRENADLNRQLDQQRTDAQLRDQQRAIEDQSFKAERERRDDDARRGDSMNQYYR